MGFWSSITSKIKKAIKRVWQKVKAIVRLIVRIAVTVWGSLIVGLPDLLFGFLAWPEKNLKYQVLILSDEKGPLIDPGLLSPSIDYLTKTFKDGFNVAVHPYGKPAVEVISSPAPKDALDVGCGLLPMLVKDFGDAGEYFAQHLAGWNAIPISLTFPITVFVIRSVGDKIGCSIGPLLDYVVIDAYDGVKSGNTLAHEIGHACNLWHSKSKSNLMWPNVDRGSSVKWFQKNLVRSSRHVYYG